MPDPNNPTPPEAASRVYFRPAPAPSLCERFMLSRIAWFMAGALAMAGVIGGMLAVAVQAWN